MLYNYDSVLNILPFPISLFEDDGFIHFQSVDLKQGSLLLEERGHKVIIWHNDLDISTYTLLYQTFRNKLSVPICLVFIDTEKEYQAILELRASPVDFREENYPSEYGSFALY